MRNRSELKNAKTIEDIFEILENLPKNIMLKKFRNNTVERGIEIIMKNGTGKMDKSSFDYAINLESAASPYSETEKQCLLLMLTKAETDSDFVRFEIAAVSAKHSEMHELLEKKKRVLKLEDVEKILEVVKSIEGYPGFKNWICFFAFTKASTNAHYRNIMSIADIESRAYEFSILRMRNGKIKNGGGGNGKNRI